MGSMSVEGFPKNNAFHHCQQIIKMKFLNMQQKLTHVRQATFALSSLGFLSLCNRSHHVLLDLFLFCHRISDTVPFSKQRESYVY